MTSTPSAPTEHDAAVPTRCEPGDDPVDVPEGRGGLARRWALVQQTAEAGMSTAEYAVGTVAACAFAAVLYRVVTGGSVVDGLSALVADALATLS
jgi:Protein of unknown function (DUF4244)